MFQKIIISSVLLCAFSFATQAQQSPIAAGGNATGTAGTASYSVGQVFFNTHTAVSGSVGQGNQQPYEIYKVGIAEATSVNISVNVFPNPTQDYFTLKVDDFENQKITFLLIDLNGKVLSTQQVLNSNTKFDLCELPASTYIVKVYQENNQIQSFKIIKN